MQGHVTVDAVEERCVLVGVITSETSEEVAQEHLDELEFLAETAGALTVEKFFQKLPYPNPRTYVGTGKLEEIKQYMKALDIELIIFDDELTGSQIMNIEKELGIYTIDRSDLILDIFARRAQTAAARQLLCRRQFHNAVDDRNRHPDMALRYSVMLLLLNPVAGSIFFVTLLHCRPGHFMCNLFPAIVATALLC